MEEKLICLACGKELSGRQTKYCCKECKNKVLGNYYNRERSQTLQNEKRLERKMFLLEKHDFKCSNCGYNKNIFALDFHHINPDEKLFALDSRNLTSRKIEEIFLEAEKCQVLCSNCHRELHNPSGELSEVNEHLKDYSKAFIKYNKKDKKDKEENIWSCEKCGNTLVTDVKFCPICSAFNRRKTERPTKEELLELVINNSFLSIGRMYNVSDTAVKKWCRSYKIPSTKKELKELKYI